MRELLVTMPMLLRFLLVTTVVRHGEIYGLEMETRYLVQHQLLRSYLNPPHLTGKRLLSVIYLHSGSARIQ